MYCKFQLVHCRGKTLLLNSTFYCRVNVFISGLHFASSGQTLYIANQLCAVGRFPMLRPALLCRPRTMLCYLCQFLHRQEKSNCGNQLSFIFESLQSKSRHCSVRRSSVLQESILFCWQTKCNRGIYLPSHDKICIAQITSFTVQRMLCCRAHFYTVGRSAALRQPLPHCWQRLRVEGSFRITIGSRSALQDRFSIP